MTNTTDSAESTAEGLQWLVHAAAVKEVSA
jgi:hypothetical protein